MLRIALPLVAAVWAGSATAETAALLIGTEDYDRVNDVRRADDVAGAASALTRAGVRVVSRRDADLEAIQQALGEFGQMIDGSDRLLVALGGRFLHSATETYFLPSDATPGPLAAISGTSLPLSTVTAWLASKPGEAVLILATDDLDADFGAFLSAGAGDIDLPQGVTLLTGAPRRVANFIGDQLARPGANMIAEARRDYSVQRYKGLGEMNPDQLWETTMNPEKRVVLQVNIEDLVDTDEVFTVLMGEEVEPRREFIQNNALHVSTLDI